MCTAASALLHASSSVAQRAAKFFLGQDDTEEDEEAEEGEGGLEVAPPSKQDVYKATAKANLLYSHIGSAWLAERAG